jgi:hypothetical protein
VTASCLCVLICFDRAGGLILCSVTVGGLCVFVCVLYNPWDLMCDCVLCDSWWFVCVFVLCVRLGFVCLCLFMLCDS